MTGVGPGPVVSTPFAGAVLTGGRSRRMGRDKALLPVGGQPMAAHVAGALAGAGAEPVLAVGGDEAALRAMGLDWTADLHPGEGPLGGLLTAFDALPGHELVAVVATDLPELTASVVAELVGALGAHDAVVARSDHLEPLCGVWRPAACRAVLQAAFDGGERAVHRALIAVDHSTVLVPLPLLRNVNEPDDLAR